MNRICGKCKTNDAVDETVRIFGKAPAMEYVLFLCGECSELIKNDWLHKQRESQRLAATCDSPIPGVTLGTYNRVIRLYSDSGKKANEWPLHKDMMMGRALVYFLENNDPRFRNRKLSDWPVIISRMDLFNEIRKEFPDQKESGIMSRIDSIVFNYADDRPRNKKWPRHEIEMLILAKILEANDHRFANRIADTECVGTWLETIKNLSPPFKSDDDKRKYHRNYYQKNKEKINKDRREKRKAKKATNEKV